MPTITLNKKDVLSLVGKSVTDSKLKERIPMLGTDLEAVTKKEIVVEVFPNRTDMVTEEGFARALSSFLGIKTGLRTYTVHPSPYTFTIDKRVRKIRPAVAAAVIKSIKMNDATIRSVMDMQDKLTLTHGRNRKKVAIGIHDLAAITFPLAYTTKPRSFSFTPLDARKPYTLNEIIEKHPKGREFGHIISSFKECPIWLDKKGQVLSMPPVINAEETKLTRATTEVFIDITGTDQHAVEQALAIITANLVDRGGEVYKVNKFPDMAPKRIKISPASINKLLGLNLSPNQIKKYVERMGMAMEGNVVLYPPYRTDMIHPVDIAEDVAIAYGYENFSPEIPATATVAEEDSFEQFKKKCADILIGLNMTEVNTYHIISKETQTEAMNDKKECLAILNPKSAEYDSLRTSLLPSLVEVLKNNRHHEYPQRIFEMATVFTKKGKAWKEAVHLAVLLSSNHADVTAIKQVLDAWCASLPMATTIKEVAHPSFIPGRAAQVCCKNKPLAILGELHPQVLANFQVEMPVAAFELNLSEVYVNHKRTH